MENSTDKSSKLNCDHRTHQDYTKPAKCKKFAELTQIETEFDQSICRYCIETKPQLEITSEPFRSQYHRLSNKGITQPSTTFEYANCIMLGDPLQQQSDPISISEYLKHKNICHYYGQCAIIPHRNRSCQLCKERLRIKYEFDSNPDFNIYGTMPKFGQIKKWAVGITTAPRKRPTIIKTIKALEHAGWDTGTIFAEPESYIYDSQNWIYVHRSRKTGIFGNWMLGLYELFIRNIDADAFFLIQDDMVIAPGTRNYLENSLWFTEQPHLVNLFGQDAIDKNRTNGWRNTTAYHGGPNSIIMSHETVQEILSSLVLLQFYGVQSQKKTSFDDLGIFVLMDKNKWPVFYPRPSLCDHIGHQSTHCTQTPKWSYSSHVLCNHQYHDVEHWYITDNRTKLDLSNMRHNLNEFSNSNWLIITDDTDPRDYLRNKCKSDWIITTELPPNTRLLSDIRSEIIKHFAYSEQWLKFGFGVKNGEYVYTENGPCKTLCERLDSLQTCMSLPDQDCRIIKGDVFWSNDASK